MGASLPKLTNLQMKEPVTSSTSPERAAIVSKFISRDAVVFLGNFENFEYLTTDRWRDKPEGLKNKVGLRKAEKLKEKKKDLVWI